MVNLSKKIAAKSKVLDASKLRLRPMRVSDAEVIWSSLTHNPDIAHMTGTQGTFTLDQVQQHLEQIQLDTDRLDFMIEPLPNPDEITLGEISFCEIDWTNRSAHFRIALFDAQLFGRGIGTEATRLMLEHGFNALNLHRIDLEVFAYNERAVHLYRKLGFVQEGIKREALLWDGYFYDAIIMSMLNSEHTAAQGL